MHNLAIALHQNGNHITGSDDGIFEPSSSRLAQYGLLPASFGWFPENINEQIDAVIIGMHALPGNPELLEAQRKHLRIYSYPEFLYEHAKDKTRVVIGGSHGKTTITSMIVHVLNSVGFDTDYLVGAHLNGFQSMVKLTDTSRTMIIEGDEYPSSPIDPRSKFLHYHPHIAVLSGIAWDHFDVFHTFEDYVATFRSFLQGIEPGGCLIYDQADPELNLLTRNIKCRKVSYSPHPHKVEGGVTMIWENSNETYPLKVFGLHNMANLNAAKLVCRELGVRDADFYQAISSFNGASKRLELLGVTADSFIYRDFAHSPSKVKATVTALRFQFPSHLLIICFELQSYSSMSELYIDLYKGTLDQADKAVVFYDPRAAAYKSITELNVNRIKQAFFNNDLQIFSDNEEMLEYLKTLTTNHFVLAFLTSGRYGGLDIPSIVPRFQTS